MGGTLEELDAISRTRPLTPSETLRLERALRRRADRKGQKPWTSADVLRLRRHLLNGKKPAQISILMSRTERAIWRQMNLLGWTVKDAGIASLWVINPTQALSRVSAKRRAYRETKKDEW